jgi:hypothetical protein
VSRTRLRFVAAMDETDTVARAQQQLRDDLELVQPREVVVQQGGPYHAV